MKHLIMLLLCVPLTAGTYQINNDAAYAGNYGMEVRAQPGNAAFVEDGTPQAADRLRFRLYLNADNLELPVDGELHIAGGYDLLANSIYTVTIVNRLGVLYLDMRARLNSGDIQGLDNPVRIPDGWNALEVDFQSATAGSLSWWLNDQPQDSLINLSNSSRVVELCRIGANDAIPDGSSGSLYLDEFVASDGSPIGTCSGNGNITPSLPNWGTTVRDVRDFITMLDQVCTSAL